MKLQIFLVGLTVVSTVAAPPPVDPNHSSIDIAVSDSTPAAATGLALLEKRDECSYCKTTCRMKSFLWPLPFLPWRLKRCKKKCKPWCDARGQNHKYMQPPRETTLSSVDEDPLSLENLNIGIGDVADVDAMMDVDVSEDDLDKEFEKAFVEYFGREPSEKERSDMQMLD